MSWGGGGGSVIVKGRVAAANFSQQTPKTIVSQTSRQIFSTLADPPSLSAWRPGLKNIMSQHCISELLHDCPIIALKSHFLS